MTEKLKIKNYPVDFSTPKPTLTQNTMSKTAIVSIFVIALLAALASAQPRYVKRDKPTTAPPTTAPQVDCTNCDNLFNQVVTYCGAGGVNCGTQPCDTYYLNYFTTCNNYGQSPYYSCYKYTGCEA